MIKKHILNIILLITVFYGNTFAQNVMKVTPLNGTESSYQISNIKKQTFLDGKMRIDFNDATTPVEFDLSIKHKVVFSYPTSVKDEVFSPLEARFFPNPVNQTLFVNYTASAVSKLNISIITLQGQKISCQNHTVNIGANQLSIPVSELNRGIYICRISDGQRAVTQKIIKE